MNIGFGITGSFCTHEKALNVLSDLVDKKHNVIPIVTDSVFSTDTRFGKHEDFIKKLEKITGNRVVSDIVGAEPLGANGIIEAMLIIPCTGNTLSKMANGITDTAVTMAAKSLMRNNKPVIIGVSTNDGLGLNLKNIAELINSKNIYFIPFRQDNYEKKPKSLVALWDKTGETLEFALKKEQIQPILV